MSKRNKNDTGVIRGNKRDNILNGTDGDDIIEGRGGNDVITGGLGDDQISGGSGSDTVVLRGSRDDYVIQQINTVRVSIIGPGGADTITHVETFDFEDLTQSFSEILLPRDPNLTAASLTAQSTTLVESEQLHVD